MFPDSEELFRVAIELQFQASFGVALSGRSTVPTTWTEFFRIERVGGTARDEVTDFPTLTIECWAQTLGRAHWLAVRIQALMHWFSEINGYQIYELQEFSGPFRDPDSVTGKPRYTATYAVAVRGSVINL